MGAEALLLPLTFGRNAIFIIFTDLHICQEKTLDTASVFMYDKSGR